MTTADILERLNRIKTTKTLDIKVSICTKPNEVSVTPWVDCQSLPKCKTISDAVTAIETHVVAPSFSPTRYIGLSR